MMGRDYNAISLDSSQASQDYRYRYGLFVYLISKDQFDIVELTDNSENGYGIFSSEEYDSQDFTDRAILEIVHRKTNVFYITVKLSVKDCVYREDFYKKCDFKIILRYSHRYGKDIRGVEEIVPSSEDEIVLFENGEHEVITRFNDGDTLTKLMDIIIERNAQ